MAALPGQLLRLQLDLTGAAMLSGTILIVPLAILGLEIYQLLEVRKPVFERLAGRGLPTAWAFYYALAAIVIVLGAYGRADFIYFNF
jgi:hypothetical protein